jgi:hypothetical protein
VESIAIERTRLKVHAANCLPAFSHSLGRKLTLCLAADLATLQGKLAT